MNIMTTTTVKNWESAATAPEMIDGRTEADIEQWRNLTEQLKTLAEQKGWSKADVARLSGMAQGTFNQWFSGKYKGRLDNQNEQIAKFIEHQNEAFGLFAAIPQSPTFFPTRVGREIMDTLTLAHIAKDLVVITIGAGIGKTIACQAYKMRRTNVFMATMSEYSKTVNAMLTDLVAELDIHERNPGRYVRAIGARLERSTNSLLIIDEAQHLIPEAVNQLRHFSDNYNCGVALVGNHEVYSTFRDSKAKERTYAQLRRRVGKWLDIKTAYAEDIQAAIAAWGVSDERSIKLLTGIGMKPGALGQIDKTMKSAHLIAMGTKQSVNYEIIKAAWKDRNVEDFA